MEYLGVLGSASPEPVEELLYGGQAGGGKSHLLRVLALHLCQTIPGTRVGLFRRSYPELEDTHIARVRQEVPRDIAVYHQSRRELRFKNGSLLAFRHCEHPHDVYRYQSSEWETLLVDEATHFTGTQIAYLRTRVRSTRPGFKPRIVYATNPGNVGHLYFKGEFVDPSPPETPFMAPRNQGGLRRLFLPARLQDNPSLDEDYRRLLEGLPDPAERASLLEGSWDVFAGQFFPTWRREVHTCDPFPLPGHWNIRGTSTDFGYGAPWSTHFWVRDEDRWHRDRQERWYVYREFYATKVDDQEQARLIAQAIREDERLHLGRHTSDANRELRWTHIADPSMWNNKPMGSQSVAQVYRSAGVHLQKGNNDRVNGWQSFRRFLAVQDDGKPGVIYFRDYCPNAIRTLPSLTYDRVNPEDIQDGPQVEDHVADENRYWFMSRGRAWIDGLIGQSAPLGIVDTPRTARPDPNIPPGYPAQWSFDRREPDRGRW